MWTPFDCLVAADVTESGLLKKYDTEVELLVVLGNSSSNSTSNSSTSNSNSNNENGVVEIRSAIPNDNDLLVPIITLPNGTIQQDTTKLQKDFNDTTSILTDLTMLITSHRIVFFTSQQQNRNQNQNQNNTNNHQQNNQTNQSRIAKYIHLSTIFTIEGESSSSFFFKSPKILLSTSIGSIYIVFLKKHNNCTKNRDDTIKQLQLALRRRVWENDISTTTTTTSTSSGSTAVQQQQSTINSSNNTYQNTNTNTNTNQNQNQNQNQNTQQRRKVGVDAIVTNVTKRNEQAAKLTESAFTGDIELLLQETTELVKIIHKYIATLDNTTTSNTSSNTDDNNDNDNNIDTQRFINMLSNMGMTSTTSASTSSLLKKSDYKGRETTYYNELIRQICDCLRPKLQYLKSNVLTVCDAYCLYNRSLHNTNLISPDDFIFALNKLNTSSHNNFGIAVLKFPDSGLKIIYDSTLVNDTTLSNRFLTMITTTTTTTSNTTTQTIQNEKQVQLHNYITALDVSHQYNIPSFLAYEQLKQIERYGTIVRDETFECIRFYKNTYFI